MIFTIRNISEFSRSGKCYNILRDLPQENVDVREYGYGKQDVPDLDVGNDGSCDSRNWDVDIVIVYVNGIGDGIARMWICDWVRWM